MEEREIRKRIKLLEPARRVNYLSRILKKERLLKPETRKYVKNVLRENYTELAKEEEKEGKFEDAAEDFIKGGMSKKESYMRQGKNCENVGYSSDFMGHQRIHDAPELYEKSESKEGFMEAARMYAEHFEVDNTVKMLIRTGMSKEEAYKKMAKDYLSKGNPIWASSIYENKLGMHEEAKKLYLEMAKDYEKEGLFLAAAEDYQKAGLENKAEEMLMRNKKTSKKGLADKLTTIFGLIGGLFFLSSNVTGNVIGNMTNSTSNWIGGILFALGLVGAFVYFKNK